MTKDDGARWRWTNRAGDCGAVPESPAADTAVPTETDTRCPMAGASGTKGAEVGRIAVAEERGRATAMIRRRRLLIQLLRLLLRCEKLLLRGELVQLELLLHGELLQIDGWQHERHGVVCAAGVDAGGRAVGRRLDQS
jgi:hypothetical protein